MAIPIPNTFDLKYCQDKQTIFDYYCKYTLTRTQSMFVYENLPETIPMKWLEYYLQVNGSCCIAEVNGKLYALLGNAGGEPDEYYQPTKYIVANPALELSKSFTIDKDCVYCKNDFMGIGLVPLISRYCGLMSENVLTIRQSDISMRNLFMLSAPDDDTFQSTKHFLDELEQGRLAVVGDSAFFDGVKMQSNSHGTGDYMIQFIELQQYLRGSLYNELGLNANFNMKREALSGEELAMNDDALMPLIDDMLKRRREFIGKVNELYGLNISVDYGSTWQSNVAEKTLIAASEFQADSETEVAMGGDSTATPDDMSVQNGELVDNVSQLNESEEESGLVENKSAEGSEGSGSDTSGTTISKDDSEGDGIAAGTSDDEQEGEGIVDGQEDSESSSEFSQLNKSDEDANVEIETSEDGESDESDKNNNKKERTLSSTQPKQLKSKGDDVNSSKEDSEDESSDDVGNVDGNGGPDDTKPNKSEQEDKDESEDK